MTSLLSASARRATAAAVALWAAAPIFAGGYSNIHSSGTPLKWNSNSISVKCDAGPLSAAVNNATAKTMVTNAISRWNGSQIPECALTMSTGADLTTDNANGNANAPDYDTGLCNDGNPVIYDQNGLLIESVIGAGQSQAVLGFAGIYCTDNPGLLIVKGRAVLNGLFIDGISGGGNPTDSSQAQYEGVVTHEIGHMLNLDHAQANMSETVDAPSTYAPNYSGFPTMFPNVHADIQDLELDDKAWISYLYPSATGSQRTKIAGVVTSSAGTNLNGVNIIARSATNYADAITCVSGYKDPTPSAIDASSNEALFEIPMLGPSTQWVLDFEPILPTYVGGSGVGPLASQLAISSQAEFLSETDTNSDSVVQSTTFVTPATTGATLPDINLRLNNAAAAAAVAEADPGPNFGTGMTVTVSPVQPLQVNASMTVETGNLSFGADDLEDYFLIPAPVAGVEVSKITVTPAAGLNVNTYLLSYDATLGQVESLASSTSGGAGVAETMQGAFNPSNAGTGAGAGRLYLAVSDANTGGTGNYTVVIHTAIADKDALVVNKPVNVNPSGPITVTGRGFKNTGGTPTVSFNNSGITVNSVTYNSPTQLTVNVTRQPSFVPNTLTDIIVTNVAGSGGYQGRTFGVTAVPVTLSGFSID